MERGGTHLIGWTAGILTWPVPGRLERSLHTLAHNASLEGFALLIENGADANAVDPRRMDTIAPGPAYGNNPQQVGLLLDHGGRCQWAHEVRRDAVVSGRQRYANARLTKVLLDRWASESAWLTLVGRAAYGCRTPSLTLRRSGCSLTMEQASRPMMEVASLRCPLRDGPPQCSPC